MLGKKVAIDLGTQSLRLLVKGEGVITSEPSVVTTEGGVQGAPGLYGVAALGAAAESARVQLRRPVAAGSVADAAALRLLINLLMARAVGRQRIFKPDVVLSVVAGMSGDDRRTILDVTMSAGARTVYLIDAVMAGAIGAGVPVTSASGHLAVDIGAGKTDVAVLAMESTIAGRSLAGHGGDRLVAGVSAHVRDAHGIALDTVVAEDVVASLLRTGPHEERRLTVTGRRDGANPSVALTSTEVSGVLDAYVRPIAAAIHDVLDETPEALLPDIHREGIVMFGGGARLEGLDRYLSGVTGIRVRIDRDPQIAVIRGAGYALDNLDVLKRNFMYIR